MDVNMFMARVAEQGDRYDDVYDFLKLSMKTKNHFTPEERNFISVAFKNLVTPKRTTWRTIMAVEQSQHPTGSTLSAIQQYKGVIEERLHKICQDIVDYLKTQIIPKVDQNFESGNQTQQIVEERCFFYKLMGDYFRYASEAATSRQSQERLPKFKKGAMEGYRKAFDICEKGLKPFNTVRLGLALNFSVFQYEVMSDPRKACEIAQSALEQALDVIDECSEETFQEAQSIIELLKENLTIWQEEIEMV